MKQTLSGFLLLGCLLASSAFAADAYQVELIVFKQTSPTGNNEVWPPLQRDMLPDTSKAVIPEPAPTAVPVGMSRTNQNPTKFILLEPASYQLQGTWDALERSDRYEPLLHIAWQQPGLDEPDTKAVRVQMGQPVPLTVQSDMASDQPAAVFADPGIYRPADTAKTLEKTTPAAPVLYSPLDGVATLTVNFYMFLQLDLVFTPTPPMVGENTAVPGSAPRFSAPTPDDQAVLEALARGELTLEQAQAMRTPAATGSTDARPTASGFSGYRLHESRRLKLNEINYFDNPLFGVIAQVRPIDFPDAAEETPNQ